MYTQDYSDSNPDDPTQYPAAAPRLTGAITGASDPRLSDGSYASDPNVLDYINKGLATSQVAAGNAGTPNTAPWQTYIDGATPAAAPKPGDVTPPGGNNGGAPLATVPPPATGGGNPAPIAPATGPVSTGTNPNQQRSDDLYNFLMGKAKQSEVVDPNDPIIRAQSDAFSASQTRTGRQYLSELAERKGAGGNIGAESRMVAEKNAQASASHEGELLQHELDSRRVEIQNALTTGAQFLTSQQQMDLQKELATIDNNMKLYQSQVQQDQFGQTLSTQKDQFGRTLAQQQAALAQSGGIAGAAQAEREREFSQNLAQRAYEYDTDNTYRNTQ